MNEHDPHRTIAAGLHPPEEDKSAVQWPCYLRQDRGCPKTCQAILLTLYGFGQKWELHHGRDECTHTLMRRGGWVFCALEQALRELIYIPLPKFTDQACHIWTIGNCKFDGPLEACRSDKLDSGQTASLDSSGAKLHQPESPVTKHTASQSNCRAI